MRISHRSSELGGAEAKNKNNFIIDITNYFLFLSNLPFFSFPDFFICLFFCNYYMYDTELTSLRAVCYEMKMHYSCFAEVYTTGNCR